MWYHGGILMITNTDIERWVTNVSMLLIVSGLFLFLYGAVGGTPFLSAALLGVPAGITGDFILPVPQSVFFAGCLLIVGGACLDVWRRLQK